MERSSCHHCAIRFLRSIPGTRPHVAGTTLDIFPYTSPFLPGPISPLSVIGLFLELDLIRFVVLWSLARCCSVVIMQEVGFTSRSRTGIKKGSVYSTGFIFAPFVSECAHPLLNVVLLVDDQTTGFSKPTKPQLTLSNFNPIF